MTDAIVSGAELPLRRAGVVAALVGFSVMGVELTAVRLLAPHFGDSAYVWTNVIGVILLALALGAWVGGRLAERRAGSPLATLLAGAALLVALAPLLARPLGDWLVPQELPLDAAMPALVSGSLVATLLLFAPPIWLMGAIAPGLSVGRRDDRESGRHLRGDALDGAGPGLSGDDLGLRRRAGAGGGVAAP